MTPQEVYCNNCGMPFSSDFNRYDGRFCHKYCSEEMNLKKSYSICGKDYMEEEREKFRRRAMEMNNVIFPD